LDATGSQTAGIWCRAIATNIDLGYQSYEVSVDFDNIKPVNYGHVGFAFNVQDDKNYDFVYIRIHQKSFSYGAYRNGGGTNIPTVNLDVPKLYSGKVYNLKLHVSTNKKFKFFLDGTQLGGEYDAVFPTLGRGGVAVAKGYNNEVNFENFQLTPTNA